MALADRNPRFHLLASSRWGKLGAMTLDTSVDLDHAALQQSARDHLWMHFTRMSSYEQS